MARPESTALPKHRPPPAEARGLGEQSLEPPTRIDPTASNASGDDPGLVEHEPVTGVEIFGKIGDPAMFQVERTIVFDVGGRQRHHQHPG